MSKDSSDFGDGDSSSGDSSVESGESLGDSLKDLIGAEISADSWLDSLKIALVNKNYDSALALLDKLPNFENHSDLLCARALVDELLEALQRDKSTLSTQMEKLKQTKRFLVD